MDSGEGKEGGHGGCNDTPAKVLQLLDQLLLVHAHKKLKKYNKQMVKKSTQIRNTIVSEGEILGGRVPAGKQGL